MLYVVPYPFDLSVSLAAIFYLTTLQRKQHIKKTAFVVVVRCTVRTFIFQSTISPPACMSVCLVGTWTRYRAQNIMAHHADRPRLLFSYCASLLSVALILIYVALYIRSRVKNRRLVLQEWWFGGPQGMWPFLSDHRLEPPEAEMLYSERRAPIDWSDDKQKRKKSHSSRMPRSSRLTLHISSGTILPT